MRSELSDRFSDAVLRDVTDRFGARSPVRLEAGENHIFRVSSDRGPFIVRIGHDVRHSPDEMRAEIDWLDHLVAAAAPVAAPVAPRSGDAVVTVPDGAGGTFVAVGLELVRGSPPWEGDRWGPGLFRRWGAAVGAVHDATGSYADPQLPRRRPDWDDPSMVSEAAWLAGREPVAHGAWLDAHDRVSRLSRGADRYGLVHFDAHAANLMVSADGSVTLLDTDDCCYSWHANDIAISLFYAMVGAADPDYAGLEFLDAFLTGYTTRCPLPTDDIRHIPDFLKLREVDLFGQILRDWGEDDEDPWNRRFMAGRRERIEAGRPFLDLPWDRWS